MASKRTDEDESDSSSDEADTPHLTAKRGMHDAKINFFRESTSYFKPLPVILSGDSSEIFRKQMADKGPDKGESYVRSAGESGSLKMSSSNVATSGETCVQAQKSSYQKASPSTHIYQKISRSRHPFTMKAKRKDVEKVISPKKITPTSSRQGILKPSTSRQKIFKAIPLKFLQFKTERTKPKTLSKVTVFKALQLHERMSTPKFLQNLILKTLKFDENLAESKKQQLQLTLPTDAEIKQPTILKPLRFDSLPSDPKVQPIGKAITCKPLQFVNSEGDSNPAFPKEIVVKPLRFADTKLKPVQKYVPGEQQQAPLPMKPPILRPMQFHQTMEPAYISGRLEKSDTSESPEISLKIDPLSIISPLESEAESSYSSMRPDEIAIPMETSILGLSDILGDTEPYALDYKSEELSPDEYFKGTKESTELIEIDEPSIEMPPSITLSIDSPEPTTDTLLESITIHKSDTSEESPQSKQASKQFSSSHFFNLFKLQKSHSIDVVPPALITKSAFKSDVLTRTRSDNVSTKSAKKVTLNETVIEIPSVTNISVNKTSKDDKYGTTRASTSKGFYKFDMNSDDVEFEKVTDPDTKEVLLSDVMQAQSSSDTVRTRLSSVMSMDHAVSLAVPEKLPEVPSIYGVDKKKYPEIYEEMMRGRYKVRIPYSMMAVGDGSSGDVAKEKKEKQITGLKKTGKFYAPEVTSAENQRPVKKNLRWRVPRKKRIYTKKRRTRLTDYKIPCLTGYFRDRRRRIDMMLVVDNTEEAIIERLKVNFLRNCAASGLELEFEIPVQKRFSDILFIKLHAPDQVLTMLAKHYGIKKLFKEHHLNFAKEACTHEVALIQGVRKNYPGPKGFSTIERITIVYRLLRTIPFGDPQNYRGVDRLLEAGILRDVYPLHDGPFFTLSRQSALQLNGRQALYLNWVGYYNIYSAQPLHLIREYLGERIAFLFAFFEYYMYALCIPSVIALFYFIYGLNSNVHDFINKEACSDVHVVKLRVPKTVLAPINFSMTFSRHYSHSMKRWWKDYNKRKDIMQECKKWKFVPCPYNRQMITTKGSFWWAIFKRGYWEARYVVTLSRIGRKFDRVVRIMDAFYYDMPICPLCDDFSTCPFINLSYYCGKIKLKNSIDNPYAMLYCVFFTIWGLLFVRLWRRRENYLSWIWEVKEEESNLRRPDYFLQKEGPVKKAYAAFVLSLTLLSVYVFSIVPMVMIYREKSFKHMMYLIKDLPSYMKYENVLFGCVAAFNGFVVMGAEAAYTKLLFYLNKSAYNHRTEREHETSLVLLLYPFTVIVNFGFIFYTAFVKGSMYTYPSDPRSWRFPLGLGTSNCGPLSCIDELCIAHVITFLSKKCFVEYDFIFETRNNELSRGRWTNKNVPCWEKEYELKQLNDDVIMAKYNYLMLQLTIVSFFAWVFPVAGILVVFLNAYEIRSWADDFLLYSRRPLPIKPWGLGAWQHVFYAIPYLAGLVNIVSYVKLSNILHRLMHRRFFPYSRYFVDFTMGFFNVTDFTKSVYAPAKGKPVKGTANYEWHQYMVMGPINRHVYKYWWVTDFCLYPGLYSRRYDRRPTVNKTIRQGEELIYQNAYIPNMNHWYICWQRGLLIILFEQFVVLSGMLVNMILRSQTDKVRTTRDAEAQIITSKLKKGYDEFDEDIFKKHEEEDKKRGEEEKKEMEKKAMEKEMKKKGKKGNLEKHKTD